MGRIHHYRSPIHSIGNWVIGYIVFLSIWNLWSLSPVINLADENVHVGLMMQNGLSSSKSVSMPLHVETGRKRILLSPLLRISSTKNEIENQKNPLSNKSMSSPSRTSSSTSMFVYVLISCSFVAGGLMAKKALDTLYQWEKESKETSLAYDMAYTTSIQSETSYGSTFSDWEDQITKFDI